MSIEFSAAIPAELPHEARTKVIGYLLSHSNYVVVRAAGHEFGLGLTGQEADSSAIETITVSFNPNVIHVAVHFATRAERVEFLRLLRGGLVDVNLKCDFEEL